MVFNFIISLLKGTIIGGDTTTFLQLNYDKIKDTDTDKSNITDLNIKKSISVSPNLHADKSSTPEIPLIAIGGAGLKILDEVVERITSYGMTYPTLGIDTEKQDLDRYDKITHKFHIPGSDMGTAHQYRKAAKRMRMAEGQFQTKLEDYFSDLKMTHEHEIVFMIMGAGGTGTGAGIEIARILKEMGKRPVPFLILPASEEMSRIQFNAAVALYTFNYAPKDRCLNLSTICIDNDLFLEKNSSKYFSSVISASNERIGATIGDIIATTEMESHAYSADLNEFLEIFRDLKGLGAIQYLQFDKPARHIFEQFEQNMETSVSLEVDVYSATRAYLYISTRPNQLRAEDFRNLLLRFDNADVFSKLYETNVGTDSDFLAIRAIYTGIAIPKRIENLMRLAEEARVHVLNKEIDRTKVGKSNPKIDQLTTDDAIDVKSGKELYDARAEELARMKRDGDK